MSPLMNAVNALEADYGIPTARGYQILVAATLPEVMETRLRVPDAASSAGWSP